MFFFNTMLRECRDIGSTCCVFNAKVSQAGPAAGGRWLPAQSFHELSQAGDRWNSPSQRRVSCILPWAQVLFLVVPLRAHTNSLFFTQASVLPGWWLLLMCCCGLALIGRSLGLWCCLLAWVLTLSSYVIFWGLSLQILRRLPFKLCLH